MKPVVSSLVALALAIAPLTVMAKPSAGHHKAHSAAAAHHANKKADKADMDKSADKSDKSEKPIVRVSAKAGKKDHKGAKPAAVHHAHNVDLGGAGHKEPKVGENGAIVAASMKAPMAHAAPAAALKPVSTNAGSSAAADKHDKHHGKSAHAKPAAKPSSAASELPRLPNPNAGKPSKGGAEKGAARKPAEKKNEGGSDSNDGELARDEEIADLVARIRGLKSIHGDGNSESESLSPSPSPSPSTSTSSSPNAQSGKAKTASHTTPAPAPKPCAKEPVEIVRGPEVERFELTKCDGTIAPLAVEHLSIMIRPGGAARPTAPLADLAKKPGNDLAPGIRRVDSRLVERIQSVADHFSKPGSPAKLFVISGYRPASVGSMHSTGRAIDFRIDGAKNEDVVGFCKTLTDTGCGFYPNSSFVHIDVRDAGAGHVTWIDASGPGETPRYVTTWPPPPVVSRHIQRAAANHGSSSSTTNDSKEADLAEEGASLLRARRPLEDNHSDHETAPEAVDTHPADVAP